ncbi:MAG: hypothetical protein K8I30_19360 [Anaerolineae bacterium]|nr:hypothetical protein [Anaerolineae bacterium]
MLLSVTGAALAQDSTWHDDMDAAPISEEVSRLIADVREGTAGFRDFEGVEDAGYGKFLDCFTNNDIGGMGQHFVNGTLVGDDVLDPMQPEALVYEPTADGDMILVAFEYLVFADAWDPNNEGREAPVLFDREFHLKTNIPETPPVWALHIWLWTSNPDGVFADYNPLVFCPADQPITDMTP